MIPNISNKISWLKNNPEIIKNINRGIERESLRINYNGNLSKNYHPESLGSPLTHKLITTDFSENLIEFITPKIKNINCMLTMLRDIHRHTTSKLNNELLWPMSMPCYIDKNKKILLSKYGNSHIGRIKSIYREGLKNRYGIAKQIISGIHYNFSFSINFWKEHVKINNKKYNKEYISNNYFKLIRNYYRFGWIITYLFGASPAICSSFLNNYSTKLPFIKTYKNTLYLPYATSLRLSNLGYKNKFINNNFYIAFNSLKEYNLKLKYLTKTPCNTYKKIGLKKNEKYLQLNNNILQNESELYTLIRPKRTINTNESLSDALLNKGVEYIEIRSLDINPFSPIGINEKQIRFIDIFLIWCLLIKSPKFNKNEFKNINKNWNKIILEGKKPELLININNKKKTIKKIGLYILKDLKKIAKIFDKLNNNYKYQKICNKIIKKIKNPNLTLSSYLLNKLLKYGINDFGLILAKKHNKKLNTESLEIINNKNFKYEKIKSNKLNENLENKNQSNFEKFIKNYNK